MIAWFAKTPLFLDLLSSSSSLSLPPPSHNVTGLHILRWIGWQIYTLLLTFYFFSRNHTLSPKAHGFVALAFTLVTVPANRMVSKSILLEFLQECPLVHCPIKLS